MNEWMNELYMEVAIQYNIMYMFIVIQLYMRMFHVYVVLNIWKVI